jgi:hypothetical protein
MDIRFSTSVSPSLSPAPQPLPTSQSPTTSSIAIPLPPEATYSSKEELYKAIQAFAAEYHYTFIIGQSNKIHKGPRIKIFYNCDRYKPPPPDNHPQNYLQGRQRHTTTRKTNCQFSVIAIQYIDTQWEFRYRPGTEYSIHNHPPSKSTSSHPAYRKLAQVEINQARSLWRNVTRLYMGIPVLSRTWNQS